MAKVWQEQLRDAIRNNRQELIGTVETSSVGGKRVLELAKCALGNEKIPKRYKVEEAAVNNSVSTFLFSSKNQEGVSTLSMQYAPVTECRRFCLPHSLKVCSTGR